MIPPALAAFLRNWICPEPAAPREWGGRWYRKGEEVEF